MARILADRHHAGLYHSLQLLGDRLGWELYTPIGYEWWDRDYWDFGRASYGDDRMKLQYLTMQPWQDAGDNESWITYDPEYPERPIRGVELADAENMEWDYILASLQDNAHGFRRFAIEHGARFIYQVGNTGQEIDWSLDPIVIASSEVPLKHGVRYHQEMHESYAWQGYPSDPKMVSSFVNLLPLIDCWPTDFKVMKALREYGFRIGIYGHSCPDGVLQPTSAIADLMARSGWGFHDKITGDGFGHVLWGWAAVGRPIIGHASHYAGQLGEVLWRDLETCIDLDKHEPAEAARLVRDITADEPRHKAMCATMRATFDANHDPARDARAIRLLLGEP